MCTRVTCSRCNRPTWAGCGRHIEQALAGVPHDQRCACDRSGGSAKRGGLLSRLFGR